MTWTLHPPQRRIERALAPIVPVTSTGTAVFLTQRWRAACSWVSLPCKLAQLLLGTLHRLLPAMAAIFAMLALGFVTKYSGMDAVLGLAFTRTGPLLYPIFGTMLGWLGVALTGSDTSSNVLFGNLQRDHRRQARTQPHPFDGLRQHHPPAASWAR